MSGAKNRGNKSGAKSRSNKTSKVDPANSDESQQIPLTDFVVEFVWKDIPEEKQELVDPNPIKAPAGTGAVLGQQPLAVGPTNVMPGMPVGATRAPANALPPTATAPGVINPGVISPPPTGAAPAAAPAEGLKPN